LVEGVFEDDEIGAGAVGDVALGGGRVEAEGDGAAVAEVVDVDGGGIGAAAFRSTQSERRIGETCLLLSAGGSRDYLRGEEVVGARGARREECREEASHGGSRGNAAALEKQERHEHERDSRGFGQRGYTDDLSVVAEDGVDEQLPCSGVRLEADAGVVEIGN